MDDLLARHRREAKALQATLTGMRKQAQADKKRKKEIFADMAKLEADLKAKHAQEVAEFETAGSSSNSCDPATTTLADAMDGLTVSAGAATAVAGAGAEPTAAPTPVSVEQPKGKKPNRQQLRKQRKEAALEQLQRDAAAEAANSVNHEQIEREQLQALLQRHKLRVHSIAPDGHCLYASIAHQLGDASTYTSLRQLAAQHLRTHPDDFRPFLVDETTGEMLTDDGFRAYCAKIESTAEWGGQIELRALAEALRRPIAVYQSSSPNPLVLGAEFGPIDQALRVSYHQHQYGLGEHYNSLVPLTK
ncbi:OTU domain-containing protein 6B [Allomyces arbusculus]|nr:OTU domain-containing protein 6B [Allomyces arbusculus]